MPGLMAALRRRTAYVAAGVPALPRGGRRQILASIGAMNRVLGILDRDDFVAVRQVASMAHHHGPPELQSAALVQVPDGRGSTPAVLRRADSDPDAVVRYAARWRRRDLWLSGPA